ncbi:hypothetical protein ACFYNX_17410 [Streptomyces sp. NPDC007872]|uniref:hypothetical protein n=1 Tax=Streptomyces sp. NPDC007872 TaxID=3364782 RepID=UPI0036C2CFA3
MRTALRTAIATALVAGAAITAPVLAAGAAFAADGPAAVPAAVSVPATTPSAPAPAASATTPAAAPAGTDEAGAKTEAPKAEDKKDEAPKTGSGEGPGNGTLVREMQILKGVFIKVFKVGERHHRAVLTQQGRHTGTLDADGQTVAGNNNGAFVVLSPTGEITAWTGGYVPHARPGVYELVNGARLELAKKDGRYGVQLVENGVGRGFTYPAGFRSVLSLGSATVVLEQDGGLAVYLSGAGRQTPPKFVRATVSPAPDAGAVITHGTCTVSKVVSIGAGTKAELFMSRQGPVAEFSDAGDDKVFALVDRAHPSLPASVGFVGRIVNPNSATPSLYTKVEGGGVKGATHAFPKLPKDCKPETAPAPSATTGTGVVQQGGQTSVVPKGGVAAGAEVAEANDAALYASAAGAAAVVAGLGLVTLRRRAAARA